MLDNTPTIASIIQDNTDAATQAGDAKQGLKIAEDEEEMQGNRSHWK